MPSSTLPPSFDAAASDRLAQALTQGPLAVAAAAELLAERGIFGMVWLDQELVARNRFGKLLDFVTLGAPITDSVAALVGLEESIFALRADDKKVIELPAVLMVNEGGATPRLNISLYWFSAVNRYLLLAAWATQKSDLETRLVAQTRARLMAEAEVTAKSKELARTNAELSRANKNLENFASIISHDLGAPMRAMRYLTGDLEAALDRDCAAAANDCKRIVAELRQQTKRLSTMLRELHEYSTIGQKHDSATEIDTRLLVQTIAASLPRPANLDLKIEGDWPMLETLAAPLDLVLRNLIDNAIKHHDATHGVIRVGCLDVGEFLSLSVCDDGPGIPEAFQNAVFLPFWTNGQPGSGTGMGLALVKGTIESIGGSLKLVSQPERSRGCKFEIMWPKRIEQR